MPNVSEFYCNDARPGHILRVTNLPELVHGIHRVQFGAGLKPHKMGGGLLSCAPMRVVFGDQRWFQVP